MAPRCEDTWVIVLEQGETAEAAFDAMNGMIDSMSKTAVFSNNRLVSGREMAEEQGP